SKQDVNGDGARSRLSQRVHASSRPTAVRGLPGETAVSVTSRWCDDDPVIVDAEAAPTAHARQPLKQPRQKSIRARMPAVRGSPYMTPLPAPSMYSSSVRLFTNSWTSQLLLLKVSEKFRMSRSSVS